MRLYLAQHGEALTAERDPARPLSDAGRRDVEALAGRLGRSGLGVARVLHSGKRRAAETAAILASVLAPAGAIESVAGLAPGDPVQAFAARAAEWREDHLVVGHMPFMARAVAFLVTGREEPGVVAFRPGALACLEQDIGGWQLAWMLRPELL